jgi:hydrophobic/amphiphilic exporter-1 (mainly G- bacteria), HAE1 family
MRNISSWAIKNPIPPIVLFFLLTIMGIGAFFRLPINSNPNIDFPAFTVSVGMPGAAPSEIENQITTRIEGALASIEGVKEIQSTVLTGSSNTFVELEIGADIAKAVDDARAAVSQVRSELPADVYEPQVQRIDFNDQDPVGIWSIQIPGMTTEDLSWLVDREIGRRLLAVEGVSRVQRSGGADREITVELNPARLTAFGATAADVSRALRSQNVDLPGGRAESGAGEQTIRTLGSAKTIDELKATPISLPGGTTVRLEDIADVRDGAAEVRGTARFNDTPVVMFEVLRSKSASALDTAGRLREEISELKKVYPTALIEPVYTPTDYIQESYDLSMVTMFEGALLATLVVAVFLGGWRPVFLISGVTGAVLLGGAWALEQFAGFHVDKVILWALAALIIAIATLIVKSGRMTFLAAIAIPLSIIPTFWAMDALGFTINDVTLLALALVAGILVDDAIVEIENIVRHIRMGKSPFAAALEAADEIGLAVVATTMTIVAVFVPVSFMSGIVGQFFKEFGLTVAIATLFSLLVARLLTPLMAAYLLSRSPPEEEPEGLAKGYLTFIDRMLSVRTRPMLWMKQGFQWGRWLVLVSGLGVMVLSVFMVMRAPVTFVPEIDQGFIQARIDLPPGISPREADARARQVAQIVLDQHGTKSVVQFVSRDLTGATFFISLTDRKDREIDQKTYQQQIREKIGQLPGIRARFGGGWGSNSVEINLVSDDQEALAAAADRVLAEMRKKTWAVDLRSSADLTRPELHISPRREEAARLGVSVSDSATAARLATDGDIDLNLAKFNAGERQIPILVRLDQSTRADLEAIKSLRVRTQFGDTVPLDAVAEVSFGGGESRIFREDRQRVVTISAGLTGGMQLGTAMEEVSAEAWYKNPGPGVQVQRSGDAEELTDMFAQFGNAIGLGVLLIYCVLVLLFRDFLHPLTIVSVILLAPAGAFMALGLVQEPLSLPVMIGLLMLIGIVIKNSILLVDFAIEAERVHGLNRHDAIMDAVRKRSRPVVMTTIAMIAGMVPAAITTAGAGAFRHGMAIAVIGGLTLSTALSLVFVPAVYTLVDDLDRAIKGLFKGVATATPEDKAIAIREEIQRRASQAPAE